MKLFSLVSAFFLLIHAQSQVVINEYSASNMNGIQDAFGDNEDWVELFNTTGASVDLSEHSV